MNKNSFNFTKKQNKIRRTWLASLVSFYIIYPLFTYLLSLVCPFLSISLETSIEPITVALLSSASALIFYLCAFKSPGVLYLHFWLIASPFNITFFLKDFFKLYEEKLLSTGTIVITAIAIVLYIGLYVLSWELKRINEATSYQRLRRLSKALDMLKKAKSLDELNQVFWKIKYKQPHLEENLLEVYFEKRTLFLRVLVFKAEKKETIINP